MKTILNTSNQNGLHSEACGKLDNNNNAINGATNGQAVHFALCHGHSVGSLIEVNSATQPIGSVVEETGQLTLAHQIARSIETGHH